jgi:uncharacterized protein (DUF1800 family)
MEAKKIQHLYFRAGFGIDANLLQKSTSKSKNEVVTELFRNAEKATPLTIDLSEFELVMTSNYINLKKEVSKEKLIELQKLGRKKLVDFNSAWINRMTISDAVLTEKMTLFWANVFVCRDNNIWHMQQYNNLLRHYALGNFGDFVKAISKSASMSKYLNNRQNVKESPNENFARELMELFTLGIGNYNETDIKESARAFTGWSFKLNGDFFLRRFKHDEGSKTFLGKTGSFNGDDIIDIILEQKQCARFICSKLYKYFVNPVLNESHLTEITERFYNDYDIKNIMQYIFNSDWFYDDENIGVKIKSPIELLVGIQKVVPVEFLQKKQLIYLEKLMGQVLLYPPNVAGWKDDKNWIDPNTLMIRLKLASIILNDAFIDIDEKGDFEDDFKAYYATKKNKKRVVKTTKFWDDFEKNYGKLTFNELKKLLIISPIDKDTESFLSNLKIKNQKEYCIQLMSIPEYQLC